MPAATWLPPKASRLGSSLRVTSIGAVRRTASTTVTSRSDDKYAAVLPYRAFSTGILARKLYTLPASVPMVRIWPSGDQLSPEIRPFSRSSGGIYSPVASRKSRTSMMRTPSVPAEAAVFS